MWYLQLYFIWTRFLLLIRRFEILYRFYVYFSISETNIKSGEVWKKHIKSVVLFKQYGHFSMNPDVLSFICVSCNFLMCYIFQCVGFKFIPKYFINFYISCKWIIFLICFSDSLLLLYNTTTDFFLCWFCILHLYWIYCSFPNDFWCSI